MGSLFCYFYACFRYFLTIVDDFSCYTWVIPMRTKSEVRNHISNFLSYVENHFQTTVKIIRSDNGVEFAMTNLFSRHYSSKNLYRNT